MKNTTDETKVRCITRKCEGCLIPCIIGDEEVIMDFGYVKRGRIVDQDGFEHEQI